MHTANYSSVKISVIRLCFSATSPERIGNIFGHISFICRENCTSLLILTNRWMWKVTVVQLLPFTHKAGDRELTVTPSLLAAQ
jgi:hypothetical protein